MTYVYKSKTYNCRYCKNRLLHEGLEIQSNNNSIIIKRINRNIGINRRTILVCRKCKHMIGKKINVNKYKLFTRRILHVTTITKYYENGK